MSVRKSILTGFLLLFTLWYCSSGGGSSPGGSSSPSGGGGGGSGGGGGGSPSLQIDTSFGGGDGIFAYDDVGNSTIVCARPNDMSVDSNGNIYVMATLQILSATSNCTLSLPYNSPFESDFAVFKIDASGGNFSSSFGSNGTLYVTGNATPSRDIGYKVEVQGSSLYLSGSVVINQGQDIRLMQIVKVFTSNGSIDSSFGPLFLAGISVGGDPTVNATLHPVLPDIPGTDGITPKEHFVILPDGRIAITGMVYKQETNLEERMFLAITTANGSGLDTSFNGVGYVVEDENATGEGSGSAIYPSSVAYVNGNFIVGGAYVTSLGTYEGVLWSYNSTGGLNANFGTAGIKILSLSLGGNIFENVWEIYPSSSSFFFIFAADSDGNLTDPIFNLDGFIAKRDLNANLVNSFGSGGIVAAIKDLKATPAVQEAAFAIKQDSSGNIYLGGTTHNATGTYWGVLTKLSSSGSIQQTLFLGDNSRSYAVKDIEIVGSSLYVLLEIKYINSNGQDRYTFEVRKFKLQ